MNGENSRPEAAAALSIDVSRLRFAYPASRRDAGPPFEMVVDRWRVERGSRVALYGPSGCGKSTLLDLVAGILRPQAGRLLVEGKDLRTLPDGDVRLHRIRTIGIVFQDFPLVAYLEALENVLLPYRLNPGLVLDREARARAEDLLGHLGLGGKERRRPGELSVGERQRVAIARALTPEPKLLLADEPTAGLDPEQGREVLELLEDLSSGRGLTLVMVTHDPTLLGRFDATLGVGSLS